MAHPQSTIKPLSTSQSGQPPGGGTVTTPRNSGHCSTYSPTICLKYRNTTGRMMSQNDGMCMQARNCICSSRICNVVAKKTSMVGAKQKPDIVIDSWKYKTIFELIKEYCESLYVMCSMKTTIFGITEIAPK